MRIFSVIVFPSRRKPSPTSTERRRSFHIRSHRTWRVNEWDSVTSEKYFLFEGRRSAQRRYCESEVLVIAEQHSWVLLTFSIEADVLTDVTEQFCLFHIREQQVEEEPVAASWFEKVDRLRSRVVARKLPASGR